MIKKEQLKSCTYKNYTKNQTTPRKKTLTFLYNQNPAVTYPPIPLRGSTIGAGGLNFSVRNGKRCFPSAITTGKLLLKIV